MDVALEGWIVDRPSSGAAGDTMPDHQFILPFDLDGPGHRRALTVEWKNLTQRVLPAMAEAHGWPISQDHCFMRVCLDVALGAPWPTVVNRPAIQNLTDGQLAAAIAVAQGVVNNPALLPALNQRSLHMRRTA